MVQLDPSQLGKPAADARATDSKRGRWLRAWRNEDRNDLTVIGDLNGLALCHRTEHRAAVVPQLAVRDCPDHQLPPSPSRSKRSKLIQRWLVS
ncbi:MAG TPA: hypothetical protein VIJ00_14580, partial [Nakamurella sp.]